MKSKTIKSVGILLRLRQQDEDRAAQSFAQAKAMVDAIRTRIGTLEGYMAIHNAQARSSLAAPVAAGSVASMGQYRQAIADIRAALADERARLAAAEDALVWRRAELTAAMKHRKAMGQLWDKLAAQRQAQQQMLEVKEADEQFAAAELTRI